MWPSALTCPLSHRTARLAPLPHHACSALHHRTHRLPQRTVSLPRRSGSRLISGSRIASYAGGDGSDGEHAALAAVVVTLPQDPCLHARMHLCLLCSTVRVILSAVVVGGGPPTACHAVVAGAVYQGMFGEWTVEPVDEFEVFSYRSGISVAAAGSPAAPD